MVKSRDGETVHLITSTMGRSGWPGAARKKWKKMEGLLDDSLQWKTLPEGMIWRKYEQTGSI